MNSTLQQAENAYKQKQYHEAAMLYEEAARRSMEDGQLLDSAELKNNASVAALLGGDPAGALAFAMNTQNAFLEAGDLRRAGIAFANQAAAQEALCNNDIAMQDFKEASELLKECGEKDLRSYVLKRISTLQLKQGKQFEALGTISAALDNANDLSPKEKLLKKLSNLVMKLLSR